MPGSSTKRSVLIVDDDASICAALTRAFELEGWSAVACPDAETALATVGTARFDVALVDKIMPGLSGVDFVRRLSERNLDLPVMLMTGSSDIQTARELLTVKVAGHLSKPFEDVFEVVRKAAGIADRNALRVDQQRRRTDARGGGPPSGEHAAVLARGASRELPGAGAPSGAPPRGVARRPASLLPPAPLPRDGASQTKPAEGEAGLRVLVVDDEPAIRLSLSTVFEDGGWTVRACADGESALAALAGEHYDVVLLDKNLPGVISGVDVAMHLRQSGSDVPIVLMTAYPTVESALRLMPYAIDAYVVKPFGDVYEVASRVRRIVDRHAREESARQKRATDWQRRRAADADTPHEGTPGAGPGGGVELGAVSRFLVASGNAEEATWMAKQLDEPSRQVEIVGSPDELSRHATSGRVDFVLLDLSFGDTVLASLEMLRVLPSAPTVILTGDRPSLGMLPRLIGAGAAGFLEKPYGTGTAFRQRVAELLKSLRQARP